jgi:hypothetical protein
MKNTILYAFFVLISPCALGQNDMSQYRYHARQADSLYEVKAYKKSCLQWQKAFDSNEGKAYPNDRYNAACAFALAGASKKAFYHLFRLAENPKVKYSNYNHIANDSDLNSLHKKKRWDQLLAIVKKNQEELEKDYDRPLIAILDSIYKEDQTYRQQIDEIESTYGPESAEMNAHWKLILEKDSLNLIKVKKILDERGWLGANVIGSQGNSTLFLVIQHSDIQTQEKYLPLMRDAVKKGNAQASSLALLEDRVLLRKGEKQIYGSQVSRDPETGEYYVLPLIDPDNVDKRRAEVNLGTLQDYISNWGMIWDVEQYKKKLPEYEERQKK